MDPKQWLKAKRTDPFWYLAIGAVFTVPMVVISVCFWDWLNGSDSGSTTIRNIGLLLGGIYALLLAIWRSSVARQQAEATENQASVARHSLMNERYQNGAKMLGDDLLSVRLGGVYALQSLADEVPENLPRANHTAFLCFRTYTKAGSRQRRGRK